jgi:hypothetical protein
VLVLVAIHTMHEVVRAKSKLILHIVGEAVHLLHTLVRESRVVMFAICEFGIAQSPSVGLLGQHLLAMLGDNLNVPLRRMAISL